MASWQAVPIPFTAPLLDIGRMQDNMFGDVRMQDGVFGGCSDADNYTTLGNPVRSAVKTV